MVWQVQDTLKLISLYRDAPELWDPEHPEYKNRITRRNAFQRMADEMNSTGNEIERKLRGIRTQFAREHVRELNGQKSIWFGYQPLAFLSKFKKSFIVEETQNDQWTEYEDIDEIELVNPEDAECVDTGTEIEKFKFVDADSIRSGWTFKRSAEVEKMSFKKSKRNTPEDTDSSYTISDEYTTFADCVIHKLRNIKSPRARSVAQYFINWVLFQAEMTNYEEDFEFETPQEFNLFRKVKKREDGS